MTGISPAHPYYPLGANIIDYSPNQSSVIELLVTAGGGCAALLGLTFTAASYVRPTLRMADRIAILWFVLCMKPLPTRLTVQWNGRNPVDGN
jgi:cholestenol delta-isomerase